MKYTFEFLGHYYGNEIWAISDGGTVHLPWKDNKPLFNQAVVKNAMNNYHPEHFDILKQLENHLIEYYNESQNY